MINAPETCKNLRLINAYDVGTEISLVYNYNLVNDSETIELKYDPISDQVKSHQILPYYYNYFIRAHYDAASQQFLMRNDRELISFNKDWKELGRRVLFPNSIPYAAYNALFSSNKRLQVAYLSSEQYNGPDTFQTTYTLTPNLGIVDQKQGFKMNRLLITNDDKIYSTTYLPLSPDLNIINYVGDEYRVKVEVRDLYLNLIDRFLPADTVVQEPSLFQVGNKLVIAGTHYPRLDDLSPTTGYLEFRPMNQSPAPTLQCGSYNVRYTGRQIIFLPYNEGYGKVGEADFVLYDMLGRVAAKRHLSDGSGTMDASGLAPGNYTGVLYCSEGKRSVLRFLKQ